MENSETPGGDGCCRFSGINAASSCLAADQFDIRIADKIVKGADRVGTAADTGKNGIREPSLFFEDLLLDFLGNDCLEIADDRREWVRSHAGTEDIVRIIDAVGPFAHGF